MSSLYSYFNNFANTDHATLSFFCIGLLISSSENLVIRKQYSPDGVFSWKILSSKPSYIGPYSLARRFAFLFGYRGTVLINLIRAATCIFLLFAAGVYFKAVLLGIIAATSLLLSYRNIVGNDGSDQMNSVIYISLLISFLFDNPFIYKLALIFIGSQSLLAYVISGIAKAAGTKWRKGIAIVQIMSTRSYGHPAVAKILIKPSLKKLNIFLCWAVILFEMTFPLVIILPNPWFLIFIIGGIFFHLYNALFMGLNSFLWTFLATYPSLFYLNNLIHIGNLR